MIRLVLLVNGHAEFEKEIQLPRRKKGVKLEQFVRQREDAVKCEINRMKIEHARKLTKYEYQFYLIIKK